MKEFMVCLDFIGLSAPDDLPEDLQQVGSLTVYLQAIDAQDAKTKVIGSFQGSYFGAYNADDCKRIRAYEKAQ